MEGHIHWTAAWTDGKIAAGQQSEKHRREASYASHDQERGFWSRLRQSFRKRFGL
jgi:hypothetical protein